MLMPYLSFNGDCEEALGLYADAFSGKIEYMSRWALPVCAPALEGKVMHAHVTFGETGAINAGDTEEPVVFGNAISLIVHFETEARANGVAAKLAAGGTLVQDFTPNPPPDDGSMCGVICDKFGYTWILVCPTE